MKNKFIPFWLIPTSWFMSSKQRELKKLEYYFEGEELERRRLSIEHNPQSHEFLINSLDIDLKYNKIKKHEYDKKKATLNNEPWIDVISCDFNTNGESGSIGFELDWNDLFVKELEKHGWRGVSPENIVESWFQAKLKDIFLEMHEEPDEEKFISSSRRTVKNIIGNNLTSYS